jgi:hypothetical protein
MRRTARTFGCATDRCGQSDCGQSDKGGTLRRGPYAPPLEQCSRTAPLPNDLRPVHDALGPAARGRGSLMSPAETVSPRIRTGFR